jgi:transcriptional regulator with XRE-family HTH domain
MVVKTLTEEIFKLAQAAQALKVRRQRLIMVVRTGVAESGFSYRELGIMFKISPSYLSEILSGRRVADARLQAFAKKLVALLRSLRKSQGGAGRPAADHQTRR